MNLVKILKENKGLTLDANGEPLKAVKGFMVAIKETQAVINSKLINNKILIQLIQNLIKNRPANAFIGLWQNDNKLYIDYSLLIEDKKEALQQAIENEQLAIFDIQSNKEIFTK